MENKEYAKQLIKEYSTQEESSVNELKKLNNQVKLPAYIFAYTYGIIGSLVLGGGMCLAMLVGSTLAMVFGIIIGVVGIAMVSTTYPIFAKILKTRKAAYAQTIIDKSNELLNNNM